eukprot:465630-Rhodomonas_salina.1
MLPQFRTAIHCASTDLRPAHTLSPYRSAHAARTGTTTPRTTHTSTTRTRTTRSRTTNPGTPHQYYSPSCYYAQSYYSHY